MKVSLNTIKQFVDFELPEVSELVERINAQLGGVEEIIDLGAKYKDALIVRVVECEKHANADKLSVTKIDDGGVRADVERDENGLVQVVCGANNVHADMWAVWLPPNSLVPSSFDDAEPFMLGSRELRGVISNGMLASNKELAIVDNHDGIVELTERDLAEDKVFHAGASFAETFGLDDTVIDIENKMFTHRPDLFGQLGVAREISAILKGLPAEVEDDTRFANPEWYSRRPEFVAAEGMELSVHNDAPEKVPRFMAVAMDDVTVGPSPFWLQAKLVAMGGKPVNNIVDITNYIMLLTAQPSHAYDYDKLRGGVLGSRMAREGETLTLLNGKRYDLSVEDIVIVDGEGPIGLAGIMGGYDTEVTVDTKRIALEVATFDMYTLRKSSMRNGLFTDALTRFNKGQSRLQADVVLAKVIEMFKEHCGVQQGSAVFDLPDESAETDEGSLSGEMEIGVEFINARLGTELSSRQIGDLLRRANFASYPLDVDEQVLLVTAPFWRTDIELTEDIVEEVGRLCGFDKLPRELPMRTMQAAPRNARREVKRKIRDSLSKAGANEVLTYSFVHENVIKRAEQDVTQAFKLSNALSPELQYYRLTVLPSLLDKVHMNIKAGHDEFTIFEIGKGHNKKYHADDDGGLPSESNFVAAVYTSKQSKSEAPYYYMRRLVQQLSRDLGFTVRYKAIDKNLDFPVTAPFDLKRSGMIETVVGGTFIGMIGELKQSVARGFKLPEYTAAMTLDLAGLQSAYEMPRQTYEPLSRYPSVTQDISLKISSDTTYDTVFATVAKSITSSDIDFRLEPVAIYQPGDDKSTKTITLRITATSHEITLRDSDVSPYLDVIAEKISRLLDGERV